MSLRILYRKIPIGKRLCNYHRCQKPIRRNIDRDKNGAIYHHGCLLAAQDEQYRCLECYQVFDATEAVFNQEETFQEGEIQEILKACCPSCGTRNVKSLSSHFGGA